MNSGDCGFTGVNRLRDVRLPGRLPLADEVMEAPTQGVIHECLLLGARAPLGLAKSRGNIGIEGKRCAHGAKDSGLMSARQYDDVETSTVPRG